MVAGAKFVSNVSENIVGTVYYNTLLRVFVYIDIFKLLFPYYHSTIQLTSHSVVMASYIKVFINRKANFVIRSIFN